jgi:hypothetical protein
MRGLLFIAAYRESGRIHPHLLPSLLSPKPRAMAGYGDNDGTANNGFGQGNRSSSWRTPARMTGTGRRRHASATLDRGPAVGPPAKAASRRRHRRTAMTPATTTAVTTRHSTAIWACRTPCLFASGRIQIYYEFGLYM